MTGSEVYPANHIKRTRATKDEMEVRAEFLIAYAEAHGPVTVRQLYYQAEVAGLPGIDKSDAAYDKIQHQVLMLRRAGRLDYGLIADMTRWMRKPRSFNSVEQALEDTARLYRKSLWHDAEDYVEVWCEKDALAGVIQPVTWKYDVPLMVTRGYTSETFCYESVAQRDEDDCPYYVYALFDFDRSGRDAAKSLEEKLKRFGAEAGIEVIFEQIAVIENQIRRLSLPTRAHKRESAADKKWPYDFAAELDAISPDYLRDLVEEAINRHLNQDQLDILKAAEESEREQLRMWTTG
ncbi:MAG: hypothetical protein ACRD3W_19450 [Terriglobales bacterium]